MGVWPRSHYSREQTADGTTFAHGGVTAEKPKKGSHYSRKREQQGGMNKKLSTGFIGELRKLKQQPQGV